jgi:hypothetical protein
MASDSGEDDYLSDKFLFAAESTAPKANEPKTYAQRRREAERASQLKNEQNRTKPRREREKEALEEGLNKSLFERAKEEEERLAADLGSSGGGGNKALSMMMKMGFQPGQALGKRENSPPPSTAVADSSSTIVESDSVPESIVGASSVDVDSSIQNDKQDHPVAGAQSGTQHRTVPLPLQEWTGMSSSRSSVLELMCFMPQVYALRVRVSYMT